MQMSDKDIIRAYKEAKDGRKQIGILADLNACPRDHIVEILSEAGVYKKPGKKPAKKEDIPKVSKAIFKEKPMPEKGTKKMRSKIIKQLAETTEKTSVVVLDDKADIYVSKEVARLLTENIDVIEEGIKGMEQELFKLREAIAIRKEEYEAYIAFIKRVKTKGEEA